MYVPRDCCEQKRVVYSLELELDSCELPSRCWEPNPGPVQEPQVFLSAEPSLQPFLPSCQPLNAKGRQRWSLNQREPKKQRGSGDQWSSAAFLGQSSHLVQWWQLSLSH